MYKQEDILKALQAGANPDDLVRQFTDAMNAAINQKNAEDQKRRQAYARKVAAMEAIIGDVFAFLKEFYPELPLTDDLRDGVDAHVILEGLDESVAEAKQFLNMFNAPAAKPQVTKKPTINIKADTSDDVLNRFLQSNG